MAKIHKIRHRIKSVGKIQQITGAMERVAASKMRRAQAAALRSRPYAATAREILAQLYLLTDSAAHPLFAQRDIKRRLFVVFSSDRGLAGAYNSNIVRLLRQSITATAHGEQKPLVIVIGQKGAKACAQLERAGLLTVIGSYTDFPVEPTTATLQPIVTTMIREFTEGEVDAVEAVFTDFVSGLKQVATLRALLPVTRQDGARLPDGQGQALGESEYVSEALFEPSPAAVLTAMVPRLVTIQVYHLSLEAAASEQSMRMVAMKSASDNAENLQDDLKLTYNNARQAVITQELAEISAGVEAAYG